MVTLLAFPIATSARTRVNLASTPWTIHRRHSPWGRWGGWRQSFGTVRYPLLAGLLCYVRNVCSHVRNRINIPYRQVGGSHLQKSEVPFDACRNPAVDRGFPCQSGGRGPLYGCPCESYASRCGPTVNRSARHIGKSGILTSSSTRRRLLPRASSPT